MNVNEALKIIMEKKGYTTATLRNALNIETNKSNVLVSRLNQENMSISKLDEMLSVMGYMLVAIPNNTAMPKDGIKIDYRETEVGAKRKKQMRDTAAKRKDDA